MDFRRERINFSSSSASASSSSQFKWVFPSSNGPRTGTEPQIYSHHHDGHHQRSSWHETQEESSRSTTPKFELMTEDSHLALQNSNIQKEHMFDKVVTPSDVGKLNRLVIPKQHAEKHFPLDSSTNEKGLLLNFEDRAGKPWRFRYSYWNSSQSYVMTKGWSRFVKEMKLDAGDIVSFQRGVGESSKDRLYIDWRRRPNPPADASFPHSFAFRRSVPWTSPLFFRPPPATVFQHNNIISYNYNSAVNPCPGSIIYLRSAAAPRDEGGIEPMVFDSVPVVHGKAAVKRLRLFGVNMECAAVSSESDESNAAAILASQSRLYNGIQLQPHFLNNGKSSSMSLDLDI